MQRKCIWGIIKMIDRLTVQAVPALVWLVLLMGACDRESTQNQSVTTTTNTDTSTAPPAREAQRRDNALVRLVHALPGELSLDVFADDSKVFSGVAYKTVIPYRELSAKTVTSYGDYTELPAAAPLMFRVRPAGQDSAQPIAENSDGLSGGNHYTIIALPRDATGKEVTLRVFSDNITPPSSDKAKVRLIHAAADAGEVDVFARGRDDALFDGVNVETATSYTEINPITVTLEIRPEGQKTAVLTVPNAKFEASKLYTIIVVGRAKGTLRLEAITVEDQLGGG
jgi:hypothetical protein